MSGVTIELGNEISPSNYDTQCDIDARTQTIKAIWSNYVDNFGTNGVTFGTIMDNNADFEIAGNRLTNLIDALRSTGKGMPQVFDLHTYADHDAVINMLRGAFQVFSDNNFLSN